jgi:hypothetical protein
LPKLSVGHYQTKYNISCRISLKAIRSSKILVYENTKAAVMTFLFQLEDSRSSPGGHVVIVVAGSFPSRDLGAG